LAANQAHHRDAGLLSATTDGAPKPNATAGINGAPVAHNTGGRHHHARAEHRARGGGGSATVHERSQGSGPKPDQQPRGRNAETCAGQRTSTPAQERGKGKNPRRPPYPGRGPVAAKGHLKPQIGSGHRASHATREPAQTYTQPRGHSNTPQTDPARQREPCNPSEPPSPPPTPRPSTHDQQPSQKH
jgi:hypothetical protein